MVSSSCGLHGCSILAESIVNEAIQPAFADFSGRDNRVVARASVLARVAVRRRIATERAAARLAGAQMHPAITRLHACFAFATARSLDAADRIDVSACIGHTGSLLLSIRRTVDGILLEADRIGNLHRHRPNLTGSAMSCSFAITSP